MAQPGFSALLALPAPALLAIFSHLHELEDAVSLSTCCKDLWALGTSSRSRFLCCAACGHRVLDPAAAFGSSAHRAAPRLDLPDGGSYAVHAEHAVQGCKLSQADHPLEGGFFATLLGLRLLGIRGVGETGQVRAQHVMCGGCGLHLGIRIVQLGKLRVGTMTACVKHWRELQVLGFVFLARRYLRLRAPDGCEEHLGRPPPTTATALYRCTAARSALHKTGECNAPLFEQRDILSREHCWDAGGGPERAFFINAFCPGATWERNERQEALCQGNMRVADVHCATCAARIGWRFCADLGPALGNANQVGRFGVVRSSIQKDRACGK